MAPPEEVHGALSDGTSAHPTAKDEAEGEVTGSAATESDAVAHGKQQ